MKKFICLQIILISFTLILNAQWVQTNGPNGGSVFSIVNANSNIFAGTERGIFRTSNNGQNWVQIFFDTLIEVNSIAVNGSSIYAGTGVGLYLTSNNGQNWNPTTLTNKYILSLIVSGPNIFAGTWLQGIYHSTNSGQTWFNTPFTNQDIFALAINGTTVFAGAYGLYRSLNNGQSWTLSSLNSQNVYSILIIGSDVYAGTFQNGVYRSTDNGQTWIQTSLNNQYIWALSNFGTKIVAGTNLSGVFLTFNNGLNWFQKNEGMGNQTIRSFNIYSNFIYAGTNNLVWKRLLSDIVDVSTNMNSVPNNYHLIQNYPNPFNPVTRIKYELPENSFVSLEVFDNLGKRVSTLVNTDQTVGYYQIDFNAENLSSGIYFYRITTGDFRDSKKMIIMK